MSYFIEDIWFILVVFDDFLFVNRQINILIKKCVLLKHLYDLYDLVILPHIKHYFTKNTVREQRLETKVNLLTTLKMIRF